MNLFKKLALLFVFVFMAGFAVSAADQNEVKDLSRAYEIWKTKGIKFVVRDDNGKFVTWNIGRLESWDTKSKWVVRDQKGRFLIHAFGKVETWKNGQTRLVIRDKKGHLLTHIDVKLTDQSSFAATVVGLRKLKNDKFLEFVQDTLADIVNGEIKEGMYSRARVLVTYLKKHASDKGVENFKDVLRKIIPNLVFAANEHPEDTKITETLAGMQETLKKL